MYYLFGRGFESLRLHDQAQLDCDLKHEKSVKLALAGFFVFKASGLKGQLVAFAGLGIKGYVIPPTPQKTPKSSMIMGV